MAVLILYHTESGDHGVCGLYERAPKDWAEELAIIEENIPDEIFDGCSYASLEVIDLSPYAVAVVPPPSPNSEDVERI